jgi:outer membrane immunogenic protein
LLGIWAGHGNRRAAAPLNETSIPTTGISIGGDGTRSGWTVGGGIDYAFTNNRFTAIEYRYSQYESKTFTYSIPILNHGFVGLKQELSNNQVTARIGYKFWQLPKLHSHLDAQSDICAASE